MGIDLESVVHRPTWVAVGHALWTYLSECWIFDMSRKFSLIGLRPISGGDTNRIAGAEARYFVSGACFRCRRCKNKRQRDGLGILKPVFSFAKRLLAVATDMTFFCRGVSGIGASFCVASVSFGSACQVVHPHRPNQLPCSYFASAMAPGRYR